MADLTLVSIDDLVNEIESRCESMVMSYLLIEQAEREGNIVSRYGKGKWSQAVFLSSNLHNDCLNNWNNELKTLQKINEEDNVED